MLEIQQDCEEKPASQKISLEGFSVRCRSRSRIEANNHMTSLEDREKQNSKQEPVVLKVDVVHDQKAGMQEERCGYESLDVGIWSSTDKPDRERQASDALCTGSGPDLLQ